MKIPLAAWDSYISRLAAINREAARQMEEYGLAHGYEAEEAIACAYDLVTKYGNAAATLTCEMYDEIAAVQGATVPLAEPAPTATYKETARAVRGTVKNKLNTVPATVGRLVKQTGADTMLQNAQRDQAQFAWVPMGDTCAFCLTLASRGWQYMSKKALKNGHAEHIHANCDCEYCIRFDGTSTVEGYDPDRYLQMYENAEGDTPQEKINAMRREIAAKKREAEEEGAKKISLPGSAERRGGTIVTNTPKKPDKPTYGHKDVTQEWLKAATPNSHPVRDLTTFSQDGVTYTVDGKSVKLEYSAHEKEIAELLERKLGGEIWMMPTVKGKYQKISTPDFLFRGGRYDLKTPTKTKPKTFYDAIHKKREQADSFIMDISLCGMTEDEAKRQIRKIFTDPFTGFVQRIILIKDAEILSIVERM